MPTAKWKTWLAWGMAGVAGIVLPRMIWFRSEPPPEGCQVRGLNHRGGDTLAIAHLKHGHRRLAILAHGFMDSMSRPGMVALAQALGERFDVVSFDFRGHGQSGGRSNLSFRQAQDDLASVIQYGRASGYEQIGVIGYSMGGAAAIMAAAQGAPVAAVASVCSPVLPHLATSRALYTPTWPWRWWARLMGIRLANTLKFDSWPIHYVARVSPTPLLIVHHGRDVWVRRQESESLFAIARPPKQYLYAPDAWHARPGGSGAQVIAWLDAQMPLDKPSDQEEAR